MGAGSQAGENQQLIIRRSWDVCAQSDRAGGCHPTSPQPDSRSEGGNLSLYHGPFSGAIVPNQPGESHFQPTYRFL